MLRHPLLGTSALGSVLFLAAAGLVGAAPALAQNVPGAEPPADALESEAEIESGTAAEASEGEIIVTGSRIRRPNLESTVPITSVGGDEFFQTGQTSVGDILNELPALHNTFTTANSTRFLGTAGLSLLDLRGLGTQRTLVLVNGRRHVPGDILGTAASVDVNMIPADLIERVDLVTGGNSAIYGSDAIAGVVNFVLKQDFEGFQLRGQSGVTKYGDLPNHYVSALAGANFDEGRGNIALNLEYAHQGDAFASGRPNLRVNSRFVQVDTDPDSPSDGTPDNIFVRDTRFPFFNNGGEFLACCQSGANSDLNLITYLFQPDGTLVQQTGAVIGTALNGTRYIGGNGSTAREGRSLALSPTIDRYSANLIAHYRVTDAFEPFVEAKYVRTDVEGSTSGPFFTATGSPREVFFTDNPFLHPETRQFILDYYGAGPDDNVPFGFTRTVSDFGDRDEKFERETYRIVAGVRGAFNDDWAYEVSANYGHFKEKNTILGNVNLQRYLLAIDAVRDPATGNIVCRAQIDPSARLPYEFPADPDFAQAQLARDLAACVPVNLFGEGNVSQAAKDYILQDTVATGRISQFVLNGFLSGDTSAFLNLPGGPIGFAVGAEYRRETARYEQEELVNAGLTFYNSIPTFDPPSFEVKELFGELRLPILRETPFFDELTVSAAGRVADYKGSTGTVFAYNVGVDWAPVRDIRLRGNFSRAVRAPNLTDLYTPLGQNFSSTIIQDPCAASFITTGTQFRQANCAAAGIPTTFDYLYDSNLEIISGGNEDLKEETSDSWTFGAVIQPRFVPGLSISVDYFNITVDDVITAPSAQQIIDACYDLPSLDNQFCSLFQRNAGPGAGPRGEEPFRILEGSLQQIILNYAKLKVRGIDVEAAYRHTFGFGTLNTRLQWTHVLQNDQFLNPADPGFADQILHELGDPENAFNWNVDFRNGPVTVGYQMRYIGRMVTNFYEDFYSKQGRPPQNPDRDDVRWYPDVFYHDVRVGVDVGERFNVYVGVDNIGNRKPPFGLTAVGAGSGIYSNIGRFFYAGAVARF